MDTLTPRKKRPTHLDQLNCLVPAWRLFIQFQNSRLHLAKQRGRTSPTNPSSDRSPGVTIRSSPRCSREQIERLIWPNLRVQTALCSRDFRRNYLLRVAFIFSGKGLGVHCYSYLAGWFSSATAQDGDSALDLSHLPDGMVGEVNWLGFLGAFPHYPPDN